MVIWFYTWHKYQWNYEKKQSNVNVKNVKNEKEGFIFKFSGMKFKVTTKIQQIRITGLKHIYTCIVFCTHVYVKSITLFKADSIR